jgi:hypothetical protein
MMDHTVMIEIEIFNVKEIYIYIISYAVSITKLEKLLVAACAVYKLQ